MRALHKIKCGLYDTVHCIVCKPNSQVQNNDDSSKINVENDIAKDVNEANKDSNDSDSTVDSESQPNLFDINDNDSDSDSDDSTDSSN